MTDLDRSSEAAPETASGTDGGLAARFLRLGHVFDDVVRVAREARDEARAELAESATARKDQAQRDAAAFDAYEQRLHAIAERAEGEMDLARAELHVALAASEQDYDKAAEALLEQWRGRIDDLRVRVSLGEMDLRDSAAEPLALLDERLDLVRARLLTTRDQGEDAVGLLRTGVGEALELLREAFDEALAVFRSSGRA